MRKKPKVTLMAVLSVIAVTVASAGLQAGKRKSKQPYVDATLRVGTQVSHFNALDQRGKLWESDRELPMYCTIVWFYEGDFLCRCIKQAKLLRGYVPELQKTGVQIVGISGDSVANHHLFSNTYELNFTLLEDSSGAIARLMGVAYTEGGKARLLDKNRKEVIDPLTNDSIFLERGVTANPWIFVIGRDGKVIYKSPARGPKWDMEAAIEFLRSRNWQSSGLKNERSCHHEHYSPGSSRCFPLPVRLPKQNHPQPKTSKCFIPRAQWGRRCRLSVRGLPHWPDLLISRHALAFGSFDPDKHNLLSQDFPSS